MAQSELRLRWHRGARRTGTGSSERESVRCQPLARAAGDAGLGRQRRRLHRRCGWRRGHTQEGTVFDAGPRCNLKWPVCASGSHAYRAGDGDRTGNHPGCGRRLQRQRYSVNSVTLKIRRDAMLRTQAWSGCVPPAGFAACPFCHKSHRPPVRTTVESHPIYSRPLGTQAAPALRADLTLYQYLEQGHGEDTNSPFSENTLDPG